MAAYETSSSRNQDTIVASERHGHLPLGRVSVNEVFSIFNRKHQSSFCTLGKTHHQDVVSTIKHLFLGGSRVSTTEELTKEQAVEEISAKQIARRVIDEILRHVRI